MKTDARFLVSRKKALGIYRELKNSSDMVSYSYKTNPDVGKVLEETDCMFSVHSFEDISALNHPGRIIYFAQAWDKDEIDSMIKRGINKFVVDNLADLDVLKTHLHDSNARIELFLRMKLKENTIQTGKHFVYGMGSSAINSLLPQMRKERFVSRLGVHFHRKTQNVSEWGILDELRDTIDEENWKLIDIVNIGGGLPVMYKNFQSSALRGIWDEIKKLKDFLNSRSIKMMIEPGRYIAGPAVMLESSVKSIYDHNIIIDCSVFNAAMDTFVAHIRLMVDGELEEGDAYTIKGCTPDSMDIFRYKVFLKDPKIGDKIVFLNAGAYNYTTDLCNLPKLKTEIVD